jgi:DNA polymerase III epsilon subunit-like protein
MGTSRTEDVGSLSGMNREPIEEVYLSVDVEADGPIPGPYSMLSFGVAVAGRHVAGRFEPADPTSRTFYRELRPISDEYVAEALAVGGLDRDELRRSGSEPEAAMTDFVAWVADTGARPVLVAYPISFDWMFLYWYLIRFTGGSPFGHSRYLDMKTMYATKAGVPVSRIGKRSMPRELLSRRPHTHHALDDAIEQAELFANLMRWPGP